MDYLRPTIDLLVSLEKWDEARRLVNTIVPYVPKVTEGYDLLSYLYYKTKQYLPAIEAGEMALASTMNNQLKNKIRFNLAKCYNFANFPERAERVLKTNLLNDPDDIDSRIDYAVALYGRGEKEKAGEILYSEVDNVKLDERNQLAVRFNLGMHELRKGNFKRGMEYLSLGRKLKIWGSYSHKFPIPEWTGSIEKGKRILIVGEGGIGDEFINSRFGYHIRQLGMVPSWASAHGLSTVIGRIGTFENTINYKNFTSDISTIQEYDYWAPAMNLPKILEIDDVNQLWNGPYLTVDPKYDKKWKEKIESTKIKIGIRWSGNPLYEQDLHRSIPINEVYDIFSDDAFELYSLQRDDGADEVKKYPNIHDLSDDLVTWDDTLAAINNMDCVISSCTSIAHASAALGQNTYILLAIMAYYTWGEEKETSSWYGSNVKLLRQLAPRDWSMPLRGLKELKDAMRNGN